MAAPLNGVRVLALGEGMVAAIATMMLADYGADVIDVREPEVSDRGSWFSARMWDRGKRHVTLDLDSATGRDRFTDLAATADIVIVGLAGDRRRRLGLGPDEVTELNPDVVYVALTAFGLEDDRPIAAHDVIAAAELGAMLAVPGLHREGPVFPGHPAIPYSTAFIAVIGALAALRARLVVGRGDVVDVSLRDGVLGQFTMNWWAESNLGSMGRRADGELDLGSIRMLVRRFRCADGREIGVHTGANGAFTRLMELLGLAERISTVTGPVESACPLTAADQAVLEELPEIFAQRTSDDWLKDIWANEIAGLPVMAPGEAFDDDQVIHNGAVRTYDEPELGPVTVVGPPIQMSVSPPLITGPSVAVDADVWWDAEGLQAVDPGIDPTATLVAGPLTGIEIVEMSTFFAAPYANRLLGDLGAAVIKLEPITGDPMRSLPDPFATVSKGKRSVAVDLKSESIGATVRALISRADIVQHNFRPGAAERLAVDEGSVRELNPEIIYNYAPGYGSTGPKSGLQSFAPLHSGFAGLHTEAAGRGNPPMACFGNEDYYNGQLNAIGQLLAIVHRQRTGRGQYVECPQLSSAVFVTSHWYKHGDERRSVLPRLDHEQNGWGPYQRLYQCLEGWLCVFCDDAAQRTAFRLAVLASMPMRRGRGERQRSREPIRLRAVRANRRGLGGHRCVRARCPAPLPVSRRGCTSTSATRRTSQRAEPPAISTPEPVS
jgi:crotonobetainyl-CoA:carnitine CoA-transferase CaiB-like acyl-CoA transferase